VFFAAKHEKEWEGVGVKEGILVWRIENFNVIKWPQKDYGHFCTGDSYIILHTFKEKGENLLKHTIFFWLGKTTSIDEMGVAAYKTVELDDLLGGVPSQSREVEGEESHEFLNLFTSSFKVTQGGVGSGFHHVGPENYTSVLLQIKGKKEL